ncbi:hypothetical protein CF086_16525 [Clostridium botulinum]|uniref:hypothetical protein n=1 Tax=Clostridium botulinum TaxID=1491 RepID=UPI0007740A28|nr:hypothetical protein [Clostridium botulinum]MBN3351902.1 hypothetical protein [Clostridium botulinum]
MKKYSVYVPVAGYIYKEVEAENEEEALDKVFDEGYEDDDIQEMDMYDKIAEGNVCYLNTSHAYAEEIDD